MNSHSFSRGLLSYNAYNYILLIFCLHYEIVIIIYVIIYIGRHQNCITSRMFLHLGFCRQSQVVSSAPHPHNHGHHGHPIHLSPVGGGGGRSPASGSVVGGAQHLGQPLYQEYTHVRSRAHPVPPSVYVTAAPSQAPSAIQQQVPTYQGFTPGWVPRHLVDACMCVPIYYYHTFFFIILVFIYYYCLLRFVHI